MGRGAAICLSYTALLLLSTVVGSRAGLWTVYIDRSPAPPAESGPAFSSHASRNRDLLTYQVVGVLGAYVGSVLIIGTLLLTVGRRLRNRALERADRPVEMVKPVYKSFEVSPMSPVGSARGWLKKKTESLRSGRSNVVSPGIESVASFDQSVVDQDRRRREEDLAQLYGHVMEFDEARAQESQTTSERTTPGAPSTSLRRQRPHLPVLQCAHTSESAPPSPQSPRSPGSPFDVIAPPKHLRAQLSPTYKPPPAELGTNHDSRAASVGSNQASDASRRILKENIRKRLGKLEISSPVSGLRDNKDGGRTPFSPRLYTHAVPPPKSPSARTLDTSPYTPTTPGSNAFPNSDERFDHLRDLPPAQSLRRNSFSRNNQATSPTRPGLPSSPAQFRVGSPCRRGHTPVSDSPSCRGPTPVSDSPSRRSHTPVGDVSRPLAFRQLAEQRNQASVSSSELNLPAPQPGWTSVGSPRLQITELYARDRQLLAIGSAALHSPGVYTPYMPVAPPTPVTPHLTTRAERRQREKEDKSIRGAITEEEQVEDEKEMWGDAY